MFQPGDRYCFSKSASFGRAGDKTLQMWARILEHRLELIVWDLGSPTLETRKGRRKGRSEANLGKGNTCVMCCSERSKGLKTCQATHAGAGRAAGEPPETGLVCFTTTSFISSIESPLLP